MYIEYKCQMWQRVQSCNFWRWTLAWGEKGPLIVKDHDRQLRTSVTVKLCLHGDVWSTICDRVPLSIHSLCDIKHSSLILYHYTQHWSELMDLTNWCWMPCPTNDARMAAPNGFGHPSLSLHVNHPHRQASGSIWRMVTDRQDSIKLRL